jgi:hypothetical protein
MKSIMSRALIALCVSLSGQALALTPITESFDGTALEPARWYQTRYGKGLLSPANGKLNFVTTGKSTKDDYAVIELTSSQPGYNEDWEFIVDLTNNTSFGSKAGCGLMLTNQQDANDYLFLDFYGKGKLKKVEGSDKKKYVGGGVFAGVYENGAHDEKNNISKNPKVAKGAIRIVFSKTTKLMTFSVSPTQKKDGYLWIPLGTFSPKGSGGKVNANWAMDPATGRFRVFLFGFSNKTAIAEGKVTIDNFSLAVP